MKHTERLRGYFESHPDTGKFFVTHDGAAFFTKENAEAYAQVFKSAEERVITEVTREEVMTKKGVKDAAPAKVEENAGQPESDPDANDKQDEKKAVPAKKAAAKKVVAKK